jgi:3-hydroxybutyryl-CoA dehydrogenase
MQLSNVKTIAICGTGTMGAGIAQLSAVAGYKTSLYDLNQAAVDKGFAIIKSNLETAVQKGKLDASELQKVLGRIALVTNVSDLLCDVAIEAIIEKKEAKQQLFNSLAKVNKPDTILATNTSSIPISTIAEGIPNPERIVGMHFFNPAHIMKLVEVISGNQTSTEASETIFQLAKKFGKTAVRAKDRPGFIVNRIGKMYHTEPIKVVEDGVADVETVDALLEGIGFKMGPFKLIDLIGVDANLNVTKSLYELMQQSQFEPSKLQQKMVDDGKLGRKSGEGFYKY